MAIGRKSEGKSIPLGVGKGLLIAIIISLLSAGIYAALIQGGNVPEASVSVWTIATLTISSLLGCILGANGVGGKYAIICSCTAGTFAFLLLASGILFFNNPLQGFVRNLLSVLGGGIAACIFLLRKPGKRRKVKTHIR